ncbi:enoyl-CoA hydratase/isomerase [Stappia indica]|uniref:enoyl-CoA hydratase/isomerase n=1 Tax=Stappia indica TaxID=538381 RepID=UPI001D192977|nr:enoyl-CoA hydratase/isomerase [Stappia indica]MCC4246103.1 enoyl-CoA hydratase/isomerase [Stappia indica]
MSGFTTISCSIAQGICRIRFARPEAGNSITPQMVQELHAAFDLCEAKEGPDGRPVTVVVQEGSDDVFCMGGDFDAVAEDAVPMDPAPLYDLWLRMARGPFVTVSVVRGRANAGGVGLAAAADIVLADESASFALSELLFGLFPACVLPFLARRVGAQRARYMTLMTRPVGARDALSFGLVDALGERADELLRQHLMRLRLPGRAGIARFKMHAAAGLDDLEGQREAALAANREMFADPQIRADIRRYVRDAKFPWEA